MTQEMKPMPGNIPEISFRIPDDLQKEFGKELRVVIRHPWVIGIPVPERLLRPEVIKALSKEFEVIATPRLR